MRVFVAEAKQHGDGRVLHIQIVLPGLEIGQHGFQSRRNRHHLEPLIDEALVPKLLHHPPHGLHVEGVHGLVVVVEIHPAAEAGDGAPPLGDMALDDAAALRVVAAHAQLGHRFLGGHAKGFVDLLLDGQPVAIPAEPPQHMAAFHGPVARHHVLQHRRHQMPVVGQAGGERRAIVEDVRWRVARGVQRPPEHVVALP